jgi:cytidyltransferase-like protein
VIESNLISEILGRARFLTGHEQIVGLCHGVFDVVHPGHLAHFKEAKSKCDLLVVSITSDRYVNKGPNRPFFDEVKRANFLASLEVVDYVFISDSPSAVESINSVKPRMYFKGSDYSDLDSDLTGKIYEEKTAVEKHNGNLCFTSGFTSSSTSIINSVLTPIDSPIRIWTDNFKKTYTPIEVNFWIDKMKDLHVTAIGETIIDGYTNCSALAKSSKDPILAFQILETNKYFGGILAIADSCSNWAKSTEVISVHGADLALHSKDIEAKYSYSLNCIEVFDRPTIYKHRFVDNASGARVFEYYDFDVAPIEEKTEELLIRRIASSCEDTKVVVAADYGHGLMTKNVITSIEKLKCFLAVNVQSNAGNRGFNTVSKWNHLDLLCLNGSELELEFRDKNLNYKEVVPSIMKLKGASFAVVTLGGAGMMVFDKSGQHCSIPALATKVVDKVGAGDSVLAISALLASQNAPIEIIALLCSVVASHEISQLGHVKGLSTIDMKRFVSSLLG